MNRAISLPTISLALGFFLSLFVSTRLVAEDGERGRLPDGRAFRTDAAGNQLVDYIAELELNIESLNRQVNGLESELADKSRLVGQLQSGNRTSEVVRERDLTGNNSPKLPQQNVGKLDCSTAVSELRATYEEKEIDLVNERDELRKGLKNSESEIKRLSDVIGENKEEIELLKTRVRQAAETQTARTDLSLEQTASPQLPSAQRALVPADIDEDSDMPRASLGARSELEAEEGAEPNVGSLRAAVSGSGALNAARVRALQSLKGRMSTELNQLKTLVTTRDSLFDRYARQAHTVSLKPSKLTSTRSLSIADIRQQLNSAQSVYEISGLSRDISEIKAKLADDIALVKRVGKFS